MSHPPNQPLQFTKTHALQNDFVIVSLHKQSVADPAALAKAICDRRSGVGADGLIILDRPDVADAHSRMRIYNADGSRAEMCGNGIRCVGKLLYERGWVRENPLRVQSDAGVRVLDLLLDEHAQVAAVRVDMGPPVLEPPQIPVQLPGPPVVEQPIAIEDTQLRVTCVSLGNPHAIVFVPRVDDVPLDDWGPQLECHALFPQRTNAHFVEVLGRDRLRMITWERGSGRTPACGTGACAACVAGVLNQHTDRAISVLLPGGTLQVEWNESTDHVSLTGSATEVFTGTWMA